MRRIINAGVDPEYILSLGPEPWDRPDDYRVHRAREYVRNRYSDESPYSAAIWADIWDAYNRNGISENDALLHELSLVPSFTVRVIAKLRKLPVSTADYRIRAVGEILETDPQLGLITDIVENFGWSGVTWVLFGGDMPRRRRRKKKPRNREKLRG